MARPGRPRGPTGQDDAGLPAPPEFSPERIKALRRSLNLTQRGFAGLVGVSVKAVRAWEGEADPRAPTGGVRRLLELLELDDARLARSLLGGVLGRKLRGE